jgi:type I restriction enzyme S subunit
LSTLESGSRETGGGNQLHEGIFSLGGEHINWDGTLNLENSKLVSEEYYNLMNQGKLKINDILLVKDGATIGKTGKRTGDGSLFFFTLLKPFVCKAFRPPSGMPFKRT